MLSTTLRRMEKGGNHHHGWLSRDYLRLDCRATGCVWNKSGECMASSLAKISATSSCDGFRPKPGPKQPDGDQSNYGRSKALVGWRTEH